MIAGPTTQDEWRALGYEVDGTFKLGNMINLSRPPENSRNLIPRLVPPQDLIDFRTFSTKGEEYAYIASAIRKNIDNDLLDPMRQILIISLEERNEAVLKDIAKALYLQHIHYYIAAAPRRDCLDYNKFEKRPNKFRDDYAVTISGIIRAKGNEADLVYVTDFDRVGEILIIPRSET